MFGRKNNFSATLILAIFPSMSSEEQNIFLLHTAVEEGEIPGHCYEKGKMGVVRRQRNK